MSYNNLSVCALFANYSPVDVFQASDLFIFFTIFLSSGHIPWSETNN